MWHKIFTYKFARRIDYLVLIFDSVDSVELVTNEGTKSRVSLPVKRGIQTNIHVRICKAAIDIVCHTRVRVSWSYTFCEAFSIEKYNGGKSHCKHFARIFY